MATTLTERVEALAASPQFALDGVCFAAGEAGLFASADGGQSWRNAYESLALESPLPTTAIALSPAFASDRLVFAGASGGVLRSSDGGEHWEKVVFPEPAPLVAALAFSPAFASDGVGFAATVEDGVFRTTDSGRSWHAWNYGLLDHSVLCLAVSPRFASDETVLAGTGSGLFRSQNGGRSWREITLPAGNLPVLSLAVADRDAGEATIFVGTEGAGCLVSADGGKTWYHAGPAEAGQAAVNAVAPAGEDSSSPGMLLLDETIFVAAGGATAWEQVSSEGVATVVAPLGVRPGAPLLAGLAAGGVVRL